MRPSRTPSPGGTARQVPVGQYELAPAAWSAELIRSLWRSHLWASITVTAEIYDDELDRALESCQQLTNDLLLECWAYLRDTYRLPPASTLSAGAASTPCRHTPQPRPTATTGSPSLRTQRAQAARQAR